MESSVEKKVATNQFLINFCSIDVMIFQIQGNQMINKNEENHKIKVAQYLRMSTDHQTFSIDNQAQYIKKYADDHNMEIICTYDDEGKSGVTAIGRNNFNKLIQDVVTGEICIEAVLVYDVSRFGRFQDNDEAGHYSYLLKYHGVKIVYCAENLPEESPEIQMLTLPALRYAAGAFSRNLSIKVFAGHVNLVKKGFYQGGIPGYGLRRKLIDSNYNEKMVLSSGERKSLQTDRVVLIPGPLNELEVINRIFNMFIFEYYNEYMIAAKLNDEGVRYTDDVEWSRSKVHTILINERYLGCYVYNRTSGKLKAKRVSNSEEEWIRYESFFDPIVSFEKFNLAKEIISSRSSHMSDDEIVEYLKKRLCQIGKLSGFIIDEDELGPSSSVVATRFGGLLNAYKLIGYTPKKDYGYIQTNKMLRSKYIEIIKCIYNKIKLKNVEISDGKILVVNNYLKLSLILSRCRKTQCGNLRWIVKFDRSLNPDISIVVRMDSTNSTPVDYYILPSLDFLEQELRIRENNSMFLELYRFSDLNLFLDMLSTYSTEAA
ncbi:recombinase family protein [Serratia quinivorans]